MGQRKDPTPSVHSLSSASEVSTASTSSIHKRSTPKIAAIIIVAFLVISSLAGVTVYFITSEKLLMATSRGAQGVNTVVEKRIDELSFYDNNNKIDLSTNSAHDFQDNVQFSTTTTVASTTSTTNQEYVDEIYDEDYYMAPSITDSYVPPIELPPIPPPTQTQQQQTGNYYKGRLGIPTNYEFNSNIRKIQPGPRFRNGMMRPKHFRDGKDPEGPPYIQYEEVPPTRESNALIGSLLTVDENRADVPAIQLGPENGAPGTIDYNSEDFDENMLLNLDGIGIFGDDFSKKIEEEITEVPESAGYPGTNGQIKQPTVSPSDLVQQRFFESGMRADPNDPNFQRNNKNQIRRRFRPRLHMRPRGQFHQQRNQQQNQKVIVSDFEVGLENKGALSRGATLATLDRRPNRPSFHHMGPPPGSHVRGPPYMRQHQQIPQQPPINRRMGGTGVLENMQEMISLAKSEVGVLRELARNVTDSGKELNLWEILDAVNATVSDNPNSGIAKLMKRFYANYLADENEPQLSDRPTPGTYEKSLSSLIFLSFGIFLLNSVNEHLTQNISQETQRSLQDNNSQQTEILSKLMSDHETLGLLFSGRSLPSSPAGSSNLINNYLRLLMNLMNIYSSETSERDVDCVWKLYCYQLNEQANLGGMASSVAKINSVGMKLVLEEIPGSAAIPAVFRSMINWNNLQCDKMFPHCVQ